MTNSRTADSSNFKFLLTFLCGAGIMKPLKTNRFFLLQKSWQSFQRYYKKKRPNGGR